MKNIKNKIADLERRIATQHVPTGEWFKKLSPEGQAAYLKEHGHEKPIGQTNSGKEIYNNHSHPAHEGFTEEDHNDAMDTHSKKGADARLNQRKRVYELAKENKALDASTDPIFQALKKKERHHSNMLNHHSGLFPTSGGKPGRHETSIPTKL